MSPTGRILLGLTLGLSTGIARAVTRHPALLALKPLVEPVGTLLMNPLLPAASGVFGAVAMPAFLAWFRWRAALKQSPGECSGVSPAERDTGVIGYAAAGRPGR